MHEWIREVVLNNHAINFLIISFAFNNETIIQTNYKNDKNNKQTNQ